jgi:putative phage-type endonuclease
MEIKREFFDVQQNSPEWDAHRLGKFTASMFGDLFATHTTATYRNAIRKVAFEKVTGESPESFTNEYMQRGHEIELLAREAYQQANMVEVSNGGFFELDEWTGCSPDGLVGENGLVEIKSPKFSTMIDYIMDNKLPSIYRHQIQGQLFVTGRQWVDFYAYHPKLKSVTLRIERDENLINEIQLQLKSSILEVQRIISIIKA